MLIEAAIVGIGIGIVVGALGAGGGILSVPVLVYLLGQNPPQVPTIPAKAKRLPCFQSTWPLGARVISETHAVAPTMMSDNVAA